jgi:ubiquinone/menaquinone biosynthesis C-methylase UbiE
VVEDGAQPLSQRMIDLAAIGPGQRVLDVATGVGEPALSAARRSGPTARVDAIDSSAAMLDLARARAAELNLENVMFREMAAENLAYPEASFDAVLCRWGLMFLENLQETLAGFRSHLNGSRRSPSAAAWYVAFSAWRRLPTGP